MVKKKKKKREREKLNIMEYHSLLIFQYIPRPRICLRQEYLSSNNIPLWQLFYMFGLTYTYTK